MVSGCVLGGHHLQLLYACTSVACGCLGLPVLGRGGSDEEQGRLPAPWIEPSAAPGRAADLLEGVADTLSGREVSHMSTPGRARAGMSLLFIQNSSLFLRNLPLNISGWKVWEASPHS